MNYLVVFLALFFHPETSSLTHKLSGDSITQMIAFDLSSDTTFLGQVSG